LLRLKKNINVLIKSITYINDLNHISPTGQTYQSWGLTVSHIRSDNCIGGVMVSVLASSVVVRGFEPQSGQAKDYKIRFVVSPLRRQH
jgi:hypothetical protein